MQYELHSQDPPEKELNPRTATNVKPKEPEPLRESLITNNTQNALLKPEMDKPKSILSKRNTSPRGQHRLLRFLCDVRHVKFVLQSDWCRITNTRTFPVFLMGSATKIKLRSMKRYCFAYLLNIVNNNNYNNKTVLFR